MKIIKVICLILLVSSLSACMTYNLSGLSAQNISAVQPARAFPKVHFNTHGPFFSSASLKSGLESTELFVEALPDWDKTGAHNTDGLYLKMSYNIEKPGDSAYVWGVVSILTLGLIPMRVANDFEMVTEVWINKRKVKTYRMPMSNITYVMMMPIPGIYLFGYSQEERNKLLIARFISNLIYMMDRDGIVFGS